MCLAFEKKNSFACEMGLFQNAMTHKLCQNANFENGGTTIQIRNMHTVDHFVNIFTAKGTWLVCQF